MDAYCSNQDNSRYFKRYGNWLPWQQPSTVRFKNVISSYVIASSIEIVNVD